ncbi:nucleotidyltransferase family protein [Faecalibacterium sp. PGM34]
MKKSLTVGCVIMASGLSRRFGANKLLADFCGQPMLCRAFAATATPGIAVRIVVTRSEEVQALCRAQGVPVLLHCLPGRNDTVRLGLSALLEQLPELNGCMFLPGDQPLLRRETVEAMTECFCRVQPCPAEWQKETERAIFRLGAVVENDPTQLVGSPVLFGSSFFRELLTLPENKGGNVLLKRYPSQVRTVCIADSAELLDADTPQMLQQLEALARLEN